MGERRTFVFGQKTAEELEAEAGLPTEPMRVNMGPSHPAMHGTVRMVLTLDGERIRESDIELGFIHRCFEKEAEYATYTQIFPYTDRLNYVSPMLNNVGFALAVERLLGIDKEIPERAQYIRVIVGEMARIADHLTCLGASAMELGAFTPFLWFLKAREWLYTLLEEVSGARLTHSYVRVGGVVADLPTDFSEKLGARLIDIARVLNEGEGLIKDLRIFRDRMEGVGVLSAADAIAYGWSGPCLRSTGVDYDVRKDHPYLVYDRLEFDVPVGTRGDNYDRFLVRMYEMRQSLRILRQALDQIPPGPILVPDYAVTLPPKAEVYNSIEGMIAHFKLIMDGIRVPPGEVYSTTEAANGELGFYIVADGTGRPYKCHVRAPSFAILTSLTKQIDGALLSDLIPTFGMVNYIAGETER
ncbi:MAG: NADH-quinone oxidoreductase subunit D [Myxococcales bacterium]|nr:NADH-quinone oxidoreductase subunit D [Myxococcales bacterium]